MTDASGNAEHWGRGDVYRLIVSALQRAGKSLDALTVEDLAPVDHYHARGFPATVELGDRLPVKAGNHVLDIGCGVGGPARYFAQRFNCRVSGLDITEPFVDAANKLSALLHLEDQVQALLGDGQRLPYGDACFDGAYALHVTMNVADRPRFFAEAYRVLRPGAFFALTEHGLGPEEGLQHPVPWSEDGSGACLITPDETHALLQTAGFSGIDIVDAGAKYLGGYKRAVQLAERGQLPPLGVHLLMGENAVLKMANAARNIEEGRTRPIEVICRRAG